MIPVTLRQFEVFAETARSGSLTKAASKLNMTQAAASMALKELESALGRELFTRAGRGLVLNASGDEALPFAERALAEAQELVEAMRDDNCGPHGKLAIGCSTTIANYDLPLRLKEMAGELPGIEVAMRVGNTLEMAKLLRSGEIDFGIVEGKVALPDIVEENWLRDELSIVAGPSHPLAKWRKPTLKKIAESVWFVREEGSGTRDCVETTLASKGLRLLITHEIGHTEAIKRMVEAGLGISCLSRMAVAREIDSGLLVQVKAPLRFERWFNIITVKGRHQSRAAKAMIEWLRDEKS